MRVAMWHLFGKRWPVWTVALVILIGFQCLTFYSAEEQKKDASQVEEWVSQCAGMGDTELDAFVDALRQELSGSLEGGEEKMQAFSRFFASYRNKKSVDNLIRFAREGEGELPVILPPNYQDRQDFYRSLPSPQVVNETALNAYFSISCDNAVLFIAIVLVSVLVGEEYEGGMALYLVTVKRGQAYRRAVRIGIQGISFLFLAISEILCLCCSGLLVSRETLTASVQSYSFWAASQMKATIGQCLLLSFVGRTISLLLFCLTAEWVARCTKNIRDTAVVSVGGLVVLLLVREGVSGRSLASLFSLGMVDWREVIGGAVRLPGAGCSTALLGVVLTGALLLLAAAGVWTPRVHCRGKGKRSIRRHRVV